MSKKRPPRAIDIPYSYSQAIVRSSATGATTIVETPPHEHPQYATQEEFNNLSDSYSLHASDPDAHHDKLHAMDSVENHSASGLTPGWVLAGDASTTFSWRKLLFSEVDADSGVGINFDGNTIEHALTSGNGILITGASVAVKLPTDSGLVTSGTGLVMGLPAELSSFTAQSVTGSTHSHSVQTTKDTGDGDANKGAILATNNAGYLKTTTYEAATSVRTPLITAPNNLLLNPTDSVEVQEAIKSPVFASGWAGTGWQADYGRISAGRSTLNVDDAYIRGALWVYELVISKIRAVNGNVFITDTGKIETVSDLGGNNYSLVTDTTTPAADRENEHGFSTGDIIMAQKFSNSNSGQIVYQSVMTVTSYTDQFQFDASLTSGAAPQPNYEYVRIGNISDNSRQGSLYLASNDSGSPFIDIKNEVDSWAAWSAADSIKGRIGNLSGIGWVPGGGYGATFKQGDAEATFATSGMLLREVPIQMYSGTIQTGDWNPDGTLKLGSNVANGGTTTFEHTGGNGVTAGDVRIGPEGGQGAFFDRDAGTMVMTGQIVVQAGSDGLTNFDNIGELATKDTANYGDEWVNGFGSVATRSSVDYNDDWVTGFGGLAELNTIGEQSTTIGGGYIQVGTWENGIRLNSDALYARSGNVSQFYIWAADGSAYAGGGAVLLDADGVTIAAGTTTRNKIVWESSSTTRGEIFSDAAGALTIDAGTSASVVVDGGNPAEGNTYVTGNLHTTGGVNASEYLDVDGDTSIQGTLYTLGQITATSSIVPLSTNVPSLGNSTKYWNYLYARYGRFSQNVTIGTTLSVGTTATIGSTLSVGGVLTAKTHVYPDANNGNDLGASGTRWRDIYTYDLHATSNVNVGGTLTASGNLSVSGDTFTGWQDMVSWQSGWGNHSASGEEGPAQCIKFGNQVILSGLVSRSSAYADGYTICYLPDGYRPQYTQLLSVLYSGGTQASGRMDIRTSGQIRIWFSGDANQWISFAGITFTTA